MLFLRSLLDDVLPAGFTLADLHALSVEFARYGSKSIDRLAFEPSSGRSLSVKMELKPWKRWSVGMNQLKRS